MISPALSIKLHWHAARGAHHRSDFPRRDSALDTIDIVIGPDGQPRRERWP
jgi:hypothetical protein